MLKATRKRVEFAPDVWVDGYLMPSGEFRAGLEGSSVLVGYAPNWLSRVLTGKRANALESLSDMGYTAYHQEVRVDSDNLRGSSLPKTISLDDLNVLIIYAATEGRKKKAIALLKGLSKVTLVDFFRHTFGVKPLSHAERMELIDEMFTDIREELQNQFLPGDAEAYGVDACADIFYLN